MLIVDGYNVLMQMGLRDKTLEVRRDHFIRILNIRNKMFGGITVVFDGKEEIEGSYIKARTPVKVIYTRGESADDCIKSMIEKSQNPQAITIATDDREIKDFAKMHFCKLISSLDLISKVSPVKKELPEEPEENKDDFVNSVKARAITDELKKKWQM
ncbi:MAG: NYN domain-containing protein [Candidatus Omnitrophica bacterium]|nr:NYN domain-containing protein [Candidatus Omnitrophota bacterium]MBU1047798.1 NYN domain-containing protein [Candidatus Omnitrophota bacterium]MBU1631085.1 NYN domain-containing protein [Candidatus Omnitrophota bacterium]MBU1767151.1 NYN domain-containing protein [Candidatus Omnitrophota bacterium]